MSESVSANYAIDAYTNLRDNLISDGSAKLGTAIAQLEGLSGDKLTAALTKVNFQMGQYNAMMELTGNIGKTMNDTLKSLCQKI